MFTDDLGESVSQSSENKLFSLKIVAARSFQTSVGSASCQKKAIHIVDAVRTSSLVRFFVLFIAFIRTCRATGEKSHFFRDVQCLTQSFSRSIHCPTVGNEYFPWSEKPIALHHAFYSSAPDGSEWAVSHFSCNIPSVRHPLEGSLAAAQDRSWDQP